MIAWSPIKLKFTLGIGALCSGGLIAELSQKAVPAWLAVGIAILPFVVFLFADPDSVSHSVVGRLQVGASLWYLGVNSLLVAMFLVGGDLKRGWPIFIIGLVIGCIPCLIVIGRAVVPGPIEEAERPAMPMPETDAGLAWDTGTESIDVSRPVVYRTNKGEQLWHLLVSCVFVAGGLLMVRDGQLAGWFVSAFFGMCGIVFILQLLPNCSSLRLSSSGLEIRSLWRTRRYDWSDISHFYAGYIGGNKMVLLIFSPSCDRAKTARTVTKAVWGAEGSLPDTYGFEAETLAERLNTWKALLSGDAGDVDTV